MLLSSQVDNTQVSPINKSFQGAYWSNDGGSTWTGADNLPNNTPGRGDPSTAFDANGNGYIATMTPVATNIDANAIGYSVQRTTNNGTTWGASARGTGNITCDKEMIAADDISTSPFANYLYSSWTGANNFVQFNRSTDQATTFSAPVNLTNYWGEGANVQTGPNGEVYVCWADYNGNSNTNYTSNGLGFSSSNGGVNFTAARRVINYIGIRQYNPDPAKMDDENPNFNGTRVNDFPSMAVDKSNGTHRGRIYAAMPVRENGNGKAIIQVSFSDNQGVAWSTPITVSIANGRQNWFPWIAADAATGLIYVVYYSLDQATGFGTNTYVATSNDGGSTFSNQKVSSVTHTTAPIQPFAYGYGGDYIGIAAYGWKAYPAWMDNRTGQWQDYVVKLDNTPVITGPAGFCNSASYTVSNLLPGSAITWSPSPTGIVNVPTAGSPVTTSKVSQGNVTLTATINGNSAASTNLNISTQPQVSSISANMSGACSNGIQNYYVTATPNMTGATSNWHWTVDNSTSGITINNPYSQNTYMNVSKGGGVSVTYTDACGETSVRNGVTIYSPCGHAFVVSPNPATSTVNISTASAKTTLTSANSTISVVNIYDAQSNLKKHIVFNKVASVSINVSELPLGIYIIEIVGGTYRERQKLQIIK